MISITPLGGIYGAHKINESDRSRYAEYFTPGLDTFICQMNNGYLYIQYAREGNITVRRYVITLKKTDIFVSQEAQPYLMFNWLQHGKIKDYNISYYGKMKCKPGYLSMVYLPANSAQIFTLTPGCYAFSQITFTDNEIQSYEKDAAYLSHFYSLYHQPESMPFPGKQIPCVKKIKADLLEIFTKGDIEYDLDRLIYSYHCKCEKEPLIHQKNISRMQDIIKYINSHPNDKCNLTEIAAHMQISPSHVKNIVKLTTNQNAGEFVTELQLQRGRLLLQNNREMRVTEVADEIGYTLPYFSRRFKQRFTVSPVEFQNGTYSRTRLFTG